ncbi:MAG: alpha-galactosidase [Anaerolineales bacterium]|nr:alpha-galactosidase [Anaerolineales bacterium]
MPIHSKPNYWILETDSTAYSLGVNSHGLLTHAYWGKRLPSQNDYPETPVMVNWESFNNAAHLTPEEYPAYTGMKYVEPDILVTFPDGVRDLVLHFEDAELQAGEKPELHVHLRDDHYPVQLTLHYRVHEAQDLIERWVSIHNLGGDPVMIERIFSALWHLPPGQDYFLSHLTGNWNDEMHLRRELLTYGSKILESRRLTTSHQHNSWFVIDHGNVDEDHGEVWFGVLAWSGNWKLTAEVTDYAATRLHQGLNDWDFAWRLNQGETFTTPSSLAGYTPDGFSSASQKLHDYAREHVLPHGKMLNKVLYNSWEATFFFVEEESQARLAEMAASIGVELFVVDDGWFHKRDNDWTGLGDWWPDEEKFPHGLAPLIQKVNSLGMDFGLWIEPEMVNPDSDLYRAYPDWVIHFPTRQRSEGRNQLILNLARQNVRDYLIEKIDHLLSEYNIRFIKWDMNRHVSEPGFMDSPGDPREIWVRYVQGVYSVWRELARRHPEVVWQSCSGGGGRADFGILQLADQIWVSDNTDAIARLSIQEGFSRVFPANTMEAWVTDAGKDILPLSFRFHASMCGVLGIGGNLMLWSPDDIAEAAKWIDTYKDIRHIIQLGDLYRLRCVSHDNCPAIQYVSKDQAESVLFAFRTYMPEPYRLSPIYLRGLIPEAMYNVEGCATPRTGAAWMHDGLQIDLNNFQSTLRLIKRVE